MITVSIHYPHKVGGHFDTGDYLNRHMPLAIDRLGAALKGVRVEIGLGGTEPGSPPAHVASCHLDFETVDAFLAAFMPHAEELQGDIPNYTDSIPIIQIGQLHVLTPRG